MLVAYSYTYKTYTKLLRTIMPRLSDRLHKGSLGKICVVGGSELYTGAPYFTAMSALRMGADLAYIICHKGAEIPIKCYGPEIIVAPYIADSNRMKEKMEIVKKCDSFVIGPGLGRDLSSIPDISEIIKHACEHNKNVVLDADALWFLAEKKLNISEYNNIKENIMLTPNYAERKRLYNAYNIDESKDGKLLLLSQILGVSIFRKSKHDKLAEFHSQHDLHTLSENLCQKRCGGQGDVLVGILAVIWNWVKKYNFSNPDPESKKNILRDSAIISSNLTKQISLFAYENKKHSLITSDIVNSIPTVMAELGLHNDLLHMFI